MQDQLPTPFGLVRSGVAPDHPETKVLIDLEVLLQLNQTGCRSLYHLWEVAPQNVEHQFTEVARDPRVTFLGNVRMGTDLQLADLRRLYSGVIATAQLPHCRCPAHKQACAVAHPTPTARLRDPTGWVPPPGGPGLRSRERQKAGHPWRGAPHTSHLSNVHRRHCFIVRSESQACHCLLGKA